MKTQKIDIRSLGLALGTSWAVGVLLIGSMGRFGWGTPLADLLASVYIGFGSTLPGLIVGALWGFVDGFLGGIIIAWLYNYFLQRSK